MRSANEIGAQSQKFGLVWFDGVQRAIERQTGQAESYRIGDSLLRFWLKFAYSRPFVPVAEGCRECAKGERYMRANRRWGRRILLGVVLFAVCGCLGTHNPSQFPYWFSAGEVVQTHAKPGGAGYFADFDPAAVKLEVHPLRSTNNVRAQHLVIASVLDKDGDGRRKRRVEWMLEGVGNIIEVDESGYLGGRGYKVDNKYAVSYTDYFEHTITRGNDIPADDFIIKPGQSWCIITSPIEGETRLTVYAPEIHDWDKRSVTATIQWVDCQWQFPTSAAIRAGTPHLLTTHVFRNTDRAPVPNYRVRYTLLDGGPEAELLPNRSREATVLSDQNGTANISIQQLNLQPGSNRVGIEVIRPADPTNPMSVPVVLARQETVIDWQAPQIQISVSAPPSVAVNQEIPATITVTNAGQVDTQSGEVRMKVPPGMQFVRSDPPGQFDSRDNQIVWPLTGLPGGRKQQLNVTFASNRVGSYPASVVAITSDSLRAENAATIRVDNGSLKVVLTGPKTAVVGDPTEYQVQITNPSSATINNVELDLWLPDGLVAVTPRGDRFEKKLQNAGIPPIEPGQSKTLPTRFDAIRAGRFQITAMASAQGGLSDQSATVIDFTQPQAQLDLRGPSTVYMNRDGNWSVTVRNTGPVPVTNATVRYRLPPELMFRGASDGGQFNPSTNEIVWNFGNLGANDERMVKLTALGVRPTTRGVVSGVLTASPNLELKKENSIEVLGVPALRVETGSDSNPVDVGRQVVYTIRITNQGTLPADQIQVIAEVPGLMKPLGGRGPQAPATVSGNTVRFPPINNLPPNQVATLMVYAQAVDQGDARFRVSVQSPSLATPLITEEATRILPLLLAPAGFRR
jgi:uncharacterized repeat protein (TIGR01451 family)